MNVLHPVLQHEPDSAEADHSDDLPKDDTSDEVTSAQEDVKKAPNAAPMQKRRRVTRACDECRRKKIKCNGSMPCSHCQIYSYDCTYDQPSQRRRNPGPAYVEALEQKLIKAESLLKTLDPTINLNDPNLDVKLPPSSASESHQSSRSPDDASKPKSPIKNEDTIDLMVRSTGQLDLGDRGRSEYYGNSSGLSWIRRIRDQFGEATGKEPSPPRSTEIVRGRQMGQDFDSPITPTHEQESPFNSFNKQATATLPSKEVAQQLCGSALNDASALLNVCHKPSFFASLNRIYDIPSSDYAAEDKRFLPLLFAVMALGALFDKSKESELEKDGYQSATHVGYEYFWAARRISDVTDCRDLTSLQAVIFMIMFLQCSAKLSTCYSYIGIALRSSLRMGLHRSFRDSFTPVEAETRKRCFWVIRKFDIYVGAMLGLPLTLNAEDIDQDLPTEVDDDFITEVEIKPMPEGFIPITVASNANFDLAKILSKIVKSIYPTSGFQSQEQSTSRSYSVHFSTIRELENDLQKWMENLPDALKPGGARLPWQAGPIPQLLRLAFAHAQMMLYRPFLHYVSTRHSTKTVDQRSYACAAACIGVSRNIIHITMEMVREGYLVGSYWFTMYTTFFAVLSLLYFVVENADSATAREILRDAESGKEILAKLAKRSMAADRCTTTLNNLWMSLPAKLSEDIPRTRKREASPKRTDSGIQPAMAPPAIPTQRPKASARTTSQRPTSGSRATLFERRTAGSARNMNMGSMTSSESSSSGSSSRGNNPDDLSQQAIMHQAQKQLHMHQQRGEIERRQSYQMQPQQPQQQHWQQNQQQQQHQQQSYQHPQYQQHQQQTQHQQHPPFHQEQQPSFPSHYPFGYNNNQPYPTDLSDLSSMMFPSADPFAYPVPPMTTLEQNSTWNTHAGPNAPTSTSHAPTPSRQHSFARVHPQNRMAHPAGDSGHHYIPASTAAANSVSADDHIDVQLFGPMPSSIIIQGEAGERRGSDRQEHMEHQQQRQQQLQAMQRHENEQHGMIAGGAGGGGGGGGGDVGMMDGMEGMGMGMWDQMQGMEGFSYEDIFGTEDDWRGAL